MARLLRVPRLPRTEVTMSHDTAKRTRRGAAPRARGQAPHPLPRVRLERAVGRVA
jgi:hypothetical protein